MSTFKFKPQDARETLLQAVIKAYKEDPQSGKTLKLMKDLRLYDKVDADDARPYYRQLELWIEAQ